MSPLEALRAALSDAAQALGELDAITAESCLARADQAAALAHAARLEPDAVCRQLHRQCEELAASLQKALTQQVALMAISSRAQGAYQKVASGD